LPKSLIGWWRAALLYCGIVFASALVAMVGAEIYLSHTMAPRFPLPFYNRLYPYVMFRPMESYTYETPDTYAMSHFKSRVFVYTNEDGFRIPAPGYKLPKIKPPRQLRIAVLGGSTTQLASTFDTTMPGALRLLLRRRYPGRDIEVVNAGIQSCVSRQSLVQLVTTVVDYHPDMVILYDGVNDLGLPLTYESRPNFPYNFQTMEEAWDEYRQERRASLFRIAWERSYLARALRERLSPSQRRLVPTADDPLAGTNALPASRVVSDRGFVRGHVAEYLSNWRKVVELSRAYRYKPVCILTPVPGLDARYAVPGMMKSFHLSREMALEWVNAFQALYDEAGRQIDGLRSALPDAIFLNMTNDLRPAETYFWDLAHVYDEVNMTIAERIYPVIRPAVEDALQSVAREPLAGAAPEPAVIP
jgi:lysophospholipase L1-like esterase